MKEIIVTTQKELDALPPKFDEYTRIIIKGGTWNDRIYIKLARGNSSVVARGNSSVVARENSSVEARGNSSVEARGNSSVVARENSFVEARGNSSVEAWGNSSIKIFSEYCNIKKALQESVIICIDCKPKLPKHKNIIYSKTATYTKKDFAEAYSEQVKDGVITLYKSVNPETECDFYTGKIKYADGETVICPDWNPDKNIQCGGGLHLSPSPSLAKSYNNGLVKKCEVNLKDLVVFPTDITKVRCKKVKVIGKI
jgi:hypothetical protein